MQIILYLQSLATGAACGLVFGLLNLPIPAPGVFAGILGIVGIFVGFLIAQAIK
jgi:XapX domain-containing protein